MEEIIDLIATDESPSNISDAIKSVLYAKAYEKVDSFRPEVAQALFVNASEDGAEQDEYEGDNE